MNKCAPHSGHRIESKEGSAEQEQLYKKMTQFLQLGAAS